MRTRFLLLVPVLLSTLAPAQAPPDVVTSVVAGSAPGSSQVMDHLDHLTNKIGPRLTGSERLTTACEWARDRFKSFGIAGARLEQWGEVQVGFDRGVHSGYMESGGVKTTLTFGTNAWTPGTDGLRSGPAILAPTKREDAEFAARAKGSWVVRGPAGELTRAEIRDLCVDQGALGLVDNGGELIITSGNMNTKWDDLPRCVTIRLVRSQHVDLVKRLQEGAEVTLAFDVPNRFRKGPVPVYNVIADIPGAEKPDEMVIVGGHIDSWDGATGTTDNGTGVATTLEAARLLMAAGAKPKRTIRFMLWSGEEQGLLGSQAWIRAHPDELPRISAVLVHDGGTNYVSGIQSTAAMMPAMKTALQPLVEALGGSIDDAVAESRPARPRDPADDGPGSEAMSFRIRRVGGLPRGVGSDHDAFLARGVPGFFWLQAGRADYRHTHHTQHDTYDAAIPEYQMHTSMVIALAALGIANLDELLSREGLAADRGPGRRRLGIQISGEGEIIVEDVREGTRGHRAGLKAGDTLLKIDGTALKDRNDLADALNSGPARKTMTIKRGGAEMNLTIDFDEPVRPPRGAPESRPDRQPR